MAARIRNSKLREREREREREVEFEEWDKTRLKS
jgi:hypothetical protein